MPRGGEKYEAKLDHLLGEAALKKGLLTPEQLRQALAEQAQGLARGRLRPRRLGVILAEKKFLTDPQVFALLDEAEKRLAEEEVSRDHDTLLGRILVDAALVRAEHVAECLLIQSEAVDGQPGPAPRLGELLVQKGYASPREINQALELQNRTVLACASCGNRARFASLDPIDPDRCPICKGRLEALPPSYEGLPVAAPPPRPAPAAAPPTVIAPAAPGEPPGERLGKYALGRLLGRGGMGDVYLATDVPLQRNVALKLMRRGSTGDGDGTSEVERFVREAQFAARMNKHPNIVTVYEAGVIDGRHYIAMEYVDGEAFSAWRKRHASSLKLQVKVLRDVAFAVHHAHQAGVLHRDLKPENILVDKEGKPYVTDFGLAKNADPGVRASLTLSGHICGTPSYMSPEQAEGKKVDRRSDVYSLGIVLYELLTGRPPFRGDTPMEVILKSLREEITPPSAVAKALGQPAVDKTLETICMKAAAKEPSRRYAGADALGKDLDRWLRGRQVKTARAAGPPKKRLWLYGIAAALLLGAFVAIGLTAGTSSVDRRLAQAARLMEEQNYAEAEALYAQVLKSHPGNARAREGREAARAKLLAAAYAEVEIALRDVEEARAHLEAARAGGDPVRRRDAEARLRDAEARARDAQERLKHLVLPP